MINNFAELLAPLTPAEFFAGYHGTRPLYLPGTPDKFASVLSWQGLSDLLSQTSLWTSRSLELVLDHHKLDATEYCRPGRDRDNRDAMLADLELVGRWLRRGASLVCNDIDNLAPGLKAVAGALESALGAKVQGNLYCSWQAHPAFGSHFDTHDVYAVHLAGEKTWRIYQRHFEAPVAHSSFKTLGDAFHEANKGPVSLEVTLKPGDLLYIPRGWYHDALATSQSTFHVAFGATMVIGLDLLALLFERAVQDPAIRSAVVQPGSERAGSLEAHLAMIGDRLAGFAREPAVIAQFKTLIANFRYQRASLQLPDDAVSPRYRRRGEGIGVSRRGDRWWIGTDRKGAPIPPGLEAQVRWVLDRASFDGCEFDTVFPHAPGEQRRQLLDDLIAMQVIERV